MDGCIEEIDEIFNGGLEEDLNEITPPPPPPQEAEPKSEEIDEMFDSQNDLNDISTPPPGT